ncbi:MULTISPECIES: ferredoxin [unclassified Mycolicibacterium]|uniref:ferredoxin n=1 Tax=unclassified Mycolicibacterium TaxID=2636767 RepID=UPI0012DCBCE9|nr:MULTISPECIES: ferredoxin [unclassified Mycolicibacterium]MUL81963.1 ferredoxin [Mycolicibacterium sp. CBMA 329]MUL87729.1 ferredoxin [Mycolicibacterium sp. CBMA 331]MUL99408.1 ferredoxin [Mycolicibacterium sp. CBMA 334]MUM29339.1 ferredoxin [Mycolicibacterium sp. CBMA 295]MUM38026.1 ferredoxin [Mycolicibacterium sp. CBMA 247]
MKVKADRDACIGSGNCVMISEVIFDQDEDGVVEVLVDEVPDEEIGHAREAVKLCPASALKLVD